MRIALCAVILLLAVPAAAQPPAPKEGDWVVRDFRFHTGETLPELRLHYTTVGDPSGMPVLILHGSGGAGTNMLAAAFGGELFGPGQPLDARRYYIILPDSIGAGRSSKPSDGLRATFPRYNYDDMVRAQYRLVTEHLGVRHLRLVMGQSAGGMQTWMWGELYPDTMDALLPLASLPVAMSGRNWMLRRMLIDAIKNDPDYNGGNYTAQPRGLRAALVYFGLATSGGTRALSEAAPTREQADRLVDARLAQPNTADANDVLYQYDSSRDYDPSPQLERITAAVLAINSEDDERNPAELRLLEREMARVKRGRHVVIPTSSATRGHGTTGSAALWKKELAALLDGTPATWIEPATAMPFVALSPGTFTMGLPASEPGREPQESAHEVTLSRPFWIGRFEVTQAQWQQVMARNPSWFAARGGDHPVENVNWLEVQEFLRRLSSRSPGNRFRLPTEAEWEYACRAGTTTAYSTGATLTAAQAHIHEHAATAVSTAGTRLAGQFAANAWGLHDMHGNVWEWTQDEHCAYANGRAADPAAVCGSALKVIRGGSWYFGADSARCALRYTHKPQDRGFSLGFRVVREPA